jgi:hypothetical protein
MKTHCLFFDVGTDILNFLDDLQAKFSSIQFVIYLRADSAVGHLQSQHGHIQQKQWTAQRQYTKTRGLYRQVLNVCIKSKLIIIIIIIMIIMIIINQFFIYYVLIQHVMVSSNGQSQRRLK